jgi:hypothetical protein
MAPRHKSLEPGIPKIRLESGGSALSRADPDSRHSALSSL